MATLTAQTIDVTGTQVTYVAAAGGGDVWVPTGDDRTFLSVVNGGGSPITVTITVPGDNFAGVALADAPVTVTNGTRKEIGPLTPDLATFGFVVISYSGVTSVTVAIISVGLPPAQLPT